MSNKTLTGSIALTKLIYAPYKTAQGNDCIMIPIEANKLEVDGNGGVYLPIRFIIRPEPDQNGQDGFIAKRIGTKEYKSMSEEEKNDLKDNNTDLSKKLTPIIGNVKDWTTSYNNATSGSVSSDVHQAPSNGEPDDFPF